MINNQRSYQQTKNIDKSKQDQVQNAWEHVAGGDPFQLSDMNSVQVQTSSFNAFSNESFPSLAEIRSPIPLNGGDS
jgi:hypothetical protein